MDPMREDTEVQVFTKVSYLPLGSLNTIFIHIDNEIKELVEDQNGSVTLLGTYHSPEVSVIKFEPICFTPHHIFQILHGYFRLETPLCQALSQRIPPLGYSLSWGPAPFLLSFHVKQIRHVLSVLPPPVTSPSRAVSDRVLQRLVDEQRVESLNLKEEGEISCSICMDNLSESSHDEKIIRMPSCLHLFHQGCIFEWLKLQNSCPLCRRVLYEDEDVTQTPRLAWQDVMLCVKVRCF